MAEAWGRVGCVGQPRAPESCLVAWQWLDLLGSGAGEVGAVHCREHALEWPYPRIDQPKPRPGPASPALGLPTPPSGCGCGLGCAVRGWTLCVAAATPPSVLPETWIPREPSSTRSAPSKVRFGDGAQAGGARTRLRPLAGYSPPQGSGQGLRLGDSFAGGELEPRRPQAHA